MRASGVPAALHTYRAAGGPVVDLVPVLDQIDVMFRDLNSRGAGATGRPDAGQELPADGTREPYRYARPERRRDGYSDRANSPLEFTERDETPSRDSIRGRNIPGRGGR